MGTGHSRRRATPFATITPDAVADDALDQQWNERLNPSVHELSRSLPAPAHDLHVPRGIVASLAPGEFPGNLGNPICCRSGGPGLLVQYLGHRCPTVNGSIELCWQATPLPVDAWAEGRTNNSVQSECFRVLRI